MKKDWLLSPIFDISLILDIHLLNNMSALGLITFCAQFCGIVS